MKLINAIVITLALCILGAGCATSGYKRADNVGTGIAQFHEEVVKLKKAVDGAMTQLSEITVTASTNPRKAFETYSKSMNRVEDARARAGARAREVKAQGAAYFKEWEKQLADMNNPEIRALAEKRKAQLNEIFARIEPLLMQAKADFDPFFSDLKDLHSLLSNDLTVAGVDAAKPIIKKTREHGTALQRSLDDLNAEMNSISATLTPQKAK